MLDHLSGPSVVTIFLWKNRGRKQANGKRRRDDDNRIRYRSAGRAHTIHAGSLRKLEKARMLVLLYILQKEHNPADILLSAKVRLPTSRNVR